MKEWLDIKNYIDSNKQEHKNIYINIIVKHSFKFKFTS